MLGGLGKVARDGTVYPSAPTGFRSSIPHIGTFGLAEVSACLFVCICVLAIVRVAQILVTSVVGESTSVSLLIRASAFSIASCLFLARSPGRPGRASMLAYAKQCTLGLFACGAIAIARGEAKWFWNLDALIVMTLAASEEVVYRSLLPRRLYAFLMGAGVCNRARFIISQILAQLTFAVSHFVVVAPTSLTTGAYAAVWFVLGGLFFSMMTLRFGLWSAIALHGAFNLEIELGYSTAFALPSLVGLVIGLVLVVLLFIRLCVTSSLPDFFGLTYRTFSSRRMSNA
jgi:Type II CAAX prenyl endopeptidase Rce1-like